jgi:hypothetical protein
MQEEFNKICLLITSDNKSSILALELLKGASLEVQAAVKAHFQTVLDAYESNTLDIIPPLLEEIERGYSFASFEQHKVLWKIPLLAKKITTVALSRLGYREKNIYRLPYSIGNLSHLETLYLDSNRLSNLPRSFKHLSQLTDLSLDDNLFEKIPSSILELSQLSRLSFQGNKLQEVPTQLEKLKRLKSIDLSFNKLQGLPNTIHQLEQLTQLLINNNSITALPESIGRFQNLHFLNGFHNPLEILPDSIGELKKLKIINFSCCNLKHLPATIGNLHKLEEVNFSYNNDLKEIPDSFFKLKNLKKLALPKSINTFISLDKLQELFPNTKIEMA